MKGKVRIHPMPKGAPAAMVEYVASVVAGGIKQTLKAHGAELSANTRGMLLGSIRKRVVNQLCCEEGLRKLRETMGEA